MDGLKDLGGPFQPKRVCDSVICGLELQDHSPDCAVHLFTRIKRVADSTDRHTQTVSC